jgi:tRNA pseudouridine38-40 synthase
VAVELSSFKTSFLPHRGASRLPADSPIPAVQNVLESALVALNCGQPVRTVLSSRTDTDVHAQCNTAHVDIDRGQSKPDYAPVTIQNAVNHYLRKNHPLRVHTVYMVPDNFHARYFATARTYVYRISANCKFPTVFERGRSYNIPYRLDVDAMKKGAEAFLGLHNFSAFSRKSDETNKCRTITRAEIRNGNGFAISCPDK